jgi:hypothetical protein
MMYSLGTMFLLFVLQGLNLNSNDIEKQQQLLA